MDIIDFMLEVVSQEFDIISIDREYNVTYVADYDEEFEPIIDVKDLGELFEEIVR